MQYSNHATLQGVVKNNFMSTHKNYLQQISEDSFLSTSDVPFVYDVYLISPVSTFSITKLSTIYRYFALASFAESLYS